jgi:hypothetical protein
MVKVPRRRISLLGDDLIDVAGMVGRATRVFWIETGLAVAAAVFCLLSIVWKDWIELVFRVDPDQGSGSLERLIALAFAALAVAFGALARRERHRLSAAR